jgi:hypothetical protein
MSDLQIGEDNRNGTWDAARFSDDPPFWRRLSDGCRLGS